MVEPFGVLGGARASWIEVVPRMSVRDQEATGSGRARGQGSVRAITVAHV